MPHLCHWPGCTVPVAPKLWGCRHHWYRLPKPLRDLIWQHYRPGQEVDKRPSAGYIDAAQQVQKWIAEQERGAKTGLPGNARALGDEECGQ